MRSLRVESHHRLSKRFIFRSQSLITLSGRILQQTPSSILPKQMMWCRNREKPLRPNSRGSLLTSCIYPIYIYSRLGSLFTVRLGTGLRIGEAFALTWDDVDFDTGIIRIYKTMAYKLGEDGRYNYRISPPKTAAGSREVPMLDEVKDALFREKSNKKPKKKFIVEGYSDFVFLNSAGQVYTNSFLYDSIQDIVETCNREELMKANLGSVSPYIC